MVRSLADDKKNLFDGISRKIRAKSVTEAMKRVPRERFVPPDGRSKAYLDVPLNIGMGQTISQPYIVALMTEALGLQGYEQVLEVGTGSGYQAAILSELLPRGKVITVELIPVLANNAKVLLRDLGYANVDVRQAGPVLGCPELAPFDAIIVAAAAPRLPESLEGQLAVGGRMVVPVGTLEEQKLVHVLRTEEGISIKMLGSCRFVPLIGPGAFHNN